MTEKVTEAMLDAAQAVIPEHGYIERSLLAEIYLAMRKASQA